MIEENLNKFLMIVFVLIINHTIKIKIMKIKTLLYVYESNRYFFIEKTLFA